MPFSIKIPHSQEKGVLVFTYRTREVLK